MNEETCDIWEKHAAGEWIAITTNPIINGRGEAVMGRGVALQAKLWFPELPRQLAAKLVERGNYPFLFTRYRLVTCPVKYHWRDIADSRLITNSVLVICDLLSTSDIERVYIPRPGCGNGQLSWEYVKSRILERCSNHSAFARCIFVDRG